MPNPIFFETIDDLAMLWNSVLEMRRSIRQQSYQAFSQRFQGQKRLLGLTCLEPASSKSVDTIDVVLCFCFAEIAHTIKEGCN